MIELMVSIGLASIVFILAGSFMAFVVEKNTKNQRTELFEQAKNDITRELSNSIKWAETVTMTDGGDGLDTLSVDKSVFELNSGKLERDHESITPDGVVITGFNVQNFSQSPTLASLQIVVKMQNSSFPLSQDVLRLVVSQRKMEVGND